MKLASNTLTTSQFTVLVCFVFIGDMALVYPALMSAGSQQDAWIAGLISIPLGLLVVRIMIAASNINPKLTIIELVLQIFGKWFGSAVTLCYLTYFLIASSMYVREVEDFMTTQIYEGTPGSVIRAMAIIMIVYGLYKGLETIGIASQLLLPFFVVFLVSLLVLVIPKMDIERIYPIMDTSFKDLWSSVWYGVFYPFAELSIFAMIYPYVSRQKHIRRDIFLALILGGLGLNLILFLSLTVLGHYYTEHDFYSAYILAQRINIGNFLQRIEALMATVWIMTTYFKTTLFVYGFLLGLTQWLKLSSYRLLILPTAFMIFGLSQFLAQDIVFYIKGIPPYWVSWNFTYAIVIPVLLLLVNKLRKRSGNQNKSA